MKVLLVTVKGQGKRRQGRRRVASERGKKDEKPAAWNSESVPPRKRRRKEGKEGLLKREELNLLCAVLCTVVGNRTPLSFHRIVEEENSKYHHQGDCFQDECVLQELVRTLATRQKRCAHFGWPKGLFERGSHCGTPALWDTTKFERVQRY